MTPSQLHTILPAAPPGQIELFLPYLSKFMTAYGITGRLREAAFIAQVGHESDSLKYTRELADGHLYEGRVDLGNLFHGDGKKFKGRGLIQITGRNNYRAVSKALKQDFETFPELLQSPSAAVESACWFWNTRSLSLIADKPESWRITIRKGKPGEVTVDRFGYITYRINGGFNGLTERKAIYARSLKVLTPSLTI
jgi:putative chitinase